jgi:hypothetical protein
MTTPGPGLSTVAVAINTNIAYSSMRGTLQERVREPRRPLGGQALAVTKLFEHRVRQQCHRAE